MADQTSTIPKGWKMTTLGNKSIQIGDGNYSSKYPRADELFESGIPFISNKDLSGGRIDSSDLRYLSDEKHAELKKGHLKTNDVLVSTRANIGDIALVTKEFDDANINAQLVFLRADEKLIHSKFLYFILSGSAYKNILGSYSSGSAQSQLPIGALKQVPLIFPPLPEQHAIAAVLSSLDDKIELLREQNKTLEATAQAIFKEWFVNFNFPGATGKMIDSELGKIPEGWRVGELGDVIEIFDSKRVPLASGVRANRKGKFPYYGATSIMDYIDDYLFDGTYLLLAEDGSVMDKNGYPVLQYVWDKFWVSNHSHVLQGKNGFTTEILYVLLKETNVTGIVNGAVQLKINQSNLTNFEILVPERDVLEKFNYLLEPMFKKIKNILQQIQALSTLRDTLLPKLMKGEVRIEGFKN